MSILHLLQPNMVVYRTQFDVRLYMPVFKYIARHTMGSIHLEAKQMIETFDGTPLRVEYMYRNCKCDICCEGRDSHMCIRLDCGHVFHHACVLKCRSPVCPSCRALRDFQ